MLAFRVLLFAVSAALLQVTYAATLAVPRMADHGTPSAVLGPIARTDESVPSNVLGNAVQSDSGKVPPGDYCTQLGEYYGVGRWTYSKIKFCLSYDRTKSTKVKVVTEDPWYYWGGAWYRGNNREISQSLSGTVNGIAFPGGSKTFTSPGSWTVNTGADYKCGNHKLAVTEFTSVGPYWGDDAQISFSDTFPITVC